MKSGLRVEEQEMTRRVGKNVDKARKLVESRAYTLTEAAEILKKAHFVKFDETV